MKRVQLNTATGMKTALAMALAAALSACGGGGGGGNVRVEPPAPPPVTPPPVTPPPVTPPPEAPPQPSRQGHLTAINALGTGLTGQGVRIGVVDSGVNRTHPALAGRVVANYTYVDPRENDLGRDDVVGHGTTVSMLAAGGAYAGSQVGVAPGAEIVSARIIADKRPVDDGSGNGNQVSGAIGLAPVHRDLVNAGVKIMNNSWGGLYWTNAATTAQIAEEYRPFITSNGGLVVFATGNDGRSTPSNMAALPSRPGVGGSMPAADLVRGWLAVTAVDTVTPTQLASYANACGEAASYCLAAPGTAVYPDPQATTATASYYYGWGTSYAAPLVSGAAALVWQRYPYFSNDLVRQTLLGTATDIGAAGVDPVFGNGLLNVGKAVNGPGRLDWGDVSVNVNRLGLDSVWSNDLSGAGGLVKQGVGALGLSGRNTYSGATRIEQGTLALRGGASITSSVSILAQAGSPSGAALQFMNGTTRVVGNVDNGASVVLTSANADATIEGNYLQRDGAQLMVALGVNALQVTGTATLQGGGVLVNGAIAGYVPADGTRQSLIRAQGGLSGQFNTAAVGQNGVSLLESSYGYDSTTAWLELTRVSVVAAASAASLDARALASAERVERAFERLDGSPDLQGSALADVAGELQRTPGGISGLSASLDSLSGKAHALATQATFDSVDMSRRAVAARFGEVQARPALRGAWQHALGEAGQGNFAGNGAQTRGWMVGHESALGGKGVLGVAFGEVRSNASGNDNGGLGRDRQAQAQLYAGWSEGRGYLLAQLGAGQFQRQVDRQLLLGAQAVGAGARYGGRFASVSVESGLRFGGPRMALTPYVAASQVQVRSDGFTEQGGLGFGLRMQDNLARRSLAMAGLRAERQWRRWTLRGYSEWQQELSSEGFDAQAGFTGVEAWAPLVSGALPRASGLLGVALEAGVGRSGRVSFGYDQRFGGGLDVSQAALNYSTGF